jgi:hypothetical protein
MNKLFSFLIFFLLVAQATDAQIKVSEHREMFWFGVFNQTRFTDKSGLWVDVHARLNDNFVNEVHVNLYRLGYVYYIKDRTRLTVGYAFQSQPGHHGAATVLEQRPWQQLQWMEKKSWFNMMQWIRLEQRFRKVGDADYDFLSHRIRYNLSLTIPITKKEVAPKTPFIFVNNEVFINFGKNIVNNYFDQNRFFMGVGYQFTSHVNAQFGYMNIFQQLPAGNQYVKADALRLFLFYNLDLRQGDHTQ